MKQFKSLFESKITILNGSCIANWLCSPVRFACQQLCIFKISVSCLFSFFSIKLMVYKIANDCIRTVDLWHRKQLLYHCINICLLITWTQHRLIFFFMEDCQRRNTSIGHASVTIINLNRASGTQTKTVTITRLNSLTATSQLPSKCKTSNKKASH